MNIDEQVIKHEHKINTLEKRVDKIETLVESVNKLAISVEKIALTQSQMLEEQKQLKQDVMYLKELPAKDAHEIKQKIAIAIITGIISVILGALLTLVIKS